MPELPEVETIRRQLCAAGIEGCTIREIRIDWPRMVEPLSPAAFRKRLKGQTVQRLSRHGKWLIFELDGSDNLLIHLRMTGGFYLTRGTFNKGPHDRAILQLSGGLNLHFRDSRKFGRWRLGGEPAGLGPDALAVTQKQFSRRLGVRDRTLKVLLLDQAFVAGIGNIYAAEALFEARLDPRRKSGTLSAAERTMLFKAVKKVLRAGVRNKGTSLGAGQGNYTDLSGESGGHREKVKVYGRAGQPCVVCSQPLRKTRIARRTTVFCAHCQK